jgi:glycosyltransferase involved in cell wall biosynthesis
MKILYHCPLEEGGLALYSQHHAAAIAAVKGVEVLWHAPNSLQPPAQCEPVAFMELPSRGPGRSRLHRAVDFLSDTLGPHRALMHMAKAARPDAVVLSCWGEYFAPLWAPQLDRLRKSGVLVAAVVHDPVRDFVRGPKWWHDWSVKEACSILDVTLVHDADLARRSGIYDRSRIVEVPHGPYPVPAGATSKETLRQEFSIPLDALVLLSFGHIRDGKNLDQAIRALQAMPLVHLLIAGREQASNQKPVEHYRDLALQVGVAERCHWHTGYIPQADVWRFFSVSDVLLLAYSKAFHSASGVLNVNAQFSLPVVASGGEGPLVRMAERYKLGVVLTDVTPEAIARGAVAALAERGDWDAFVAANSWERNARETVAALSGVARG